MSDSAPPATRSQQKGRIGGRRDPASKSHGRLSIMLHSNARSDHLTKMAIRLMPAGLKRAARRVVDADPSLKMRAWRAAEIVLVGAAIPDRPDAITIFDLDDEAEGVTVALEGAGRRCECGKSSCTHVLAAAFAVEDPDGLIAVRQEGTNVGSWEYVEQRFVSRL